MSQQASYVHGREHMFCFASAQQLSQHIACCVQSKGQQPMYVTGRGGSFRTSSSAGAAYRLQWIRHIRRAPCISMRRQLSARLHTRRSNAASPASWESLPWSVPSFQPVNNFGADLVSACNTVMQLVYICHAYKCSLHLSLRQ